MSIPFCSPCSVSSKSSTLVWKRACFGIVGKRPVAALGDWRRGRISTESTPRGLPSRHRHRHRHLTTVQGESSGTSHVYFNNDVELIIVQGEGNGAIYFDDSGHLCSCRPYLSSKARLPQAVRIVG